MSKMSELCLEIEMMLEEDVKPNTIAVRLGIPVSFVYDVIETIQDEQFEETSPFNTLNS